MEFEEAIFLIGFTTGSEFAPKLLEFESQNNHFKKIFPLTEKYTAYVHLSLFLTSLSMCV
jgi:hypothetical protein